MIKWNKQFEYPTSVRSLINNQRHYAVNDRKLPSVTTILQATQSEEKKQSLERWKQKVGDQAAENIKNVAANRGSILHRIIEGYLMDQRHADLSDLGQQAGTMAQIVIDEEIKPNISEIWGIEATLYHEGIGYAGATDFIGIHEGKAAICDWKQSNKPKRKEWIHDYGLQLAAYSLAFQDMFNETIHKGVNAIITADNYYQRFVWEGEEFKQLKYEWMRKVEQYYNNLDKNQEK